MTQERRELHEELDAGKPHIRLVSMGVSTRPMWWPFLEIGRNLKMTSVQRQVLRMMLELL